MTEKNNAYQTGIQEGMRRERMFQAAAAPAPEPAGDGLLSEREIIDADINTLTDDLMSRFEAVAAAQHAKDQEQLAAKDAAWQLRLEESEREGSHVCEQWAVEVETRVAEIERLRAALEKIKVPGVSVAQVIAKAALAAERE